MKCYYVNIVKNLLKDILLENNFCFSRESKTWVG